MYTIFKNIVFFLVILVPTSTPTLFLFNLESLSHEPAGLEPFSIHFLPL